MNYSDSDTRITRISTNLELASMVHVLAFRLQSREEGPPKPEKQRQTQPNTEPVSQTASDTVTVKQEKA